MANVEIMNATEVCSLIIAQTGKTEEEVKDLIQRKMDELEGLINVDGAAHIIAKALGVDTINSPIKKEDKKVEGSENACTECNTEVTNQKTIDFSKRKFGKVLCWNCQQGGKDTPGPAPVAKPPMQQEFGNGMFSEIQIQMIHKDTIVMMAASEQNPLGTEFDDTYDKTFNVIMKNFRKKVTTLGRGQ